ncbi:MAG: nucleotidyltransferase domain-containing protein [Candidatus Methylomirabilales bacterium]
MVERRALEEVRDALRAGLGEGLWGLVVFGSAARGEDRAGSDGDLLLVAEELPERFLERHRFLRALLPLARRGRVSFIGKARAEFEAGFPSYYLDVALDGIILADRDRYMEGKLQWIRDVIREAGLRRRRAPAGFVWEWDCPPAGPWRIDWTGAYGLREGRPVPAEAR